jgi:hypothetical protein
MTIQMSSTTKVVELNGVPARIWEGETASGIKCHAYITRIAVDPGQDETQFQAELTECEPPSPELEAIPLRMIL